MRLRLVLVLLVALLLPAATALASGRDVLRDCADDEILNKTYTQKEYRDALSQLATDNSEYSDCERVIRRAQLEQAAGPRRNGGPGGPGGGGGGGGTTPPSGGSAGGHPGTPAAPTQPTTPPARGSDPLAALSPDERL